MADNIVAGLFGLDPWQIQQQQFNNLDVQASNFAGMTPAQQGSYGIYKGAGLLGNAIAQKFGMVNPAIQESQQKQELFQGSDLNSIEGLRNASVKFNQSGDARTAYLLSSKANELEAQQYENMKNAALATKALREETAQF